MSVEQDNFVCYTDVKENVLSKITYYEKNKRQKSHCLNVFFEHEKQLYCRLI